MLTRVAGEARPNPRARGKRQQPRPRQRRPRGEPEEAWPASYDVWAGPLSDRGGPAGYHVKIGGGASGGASSVATTTTQQPGSRGEASLLSPERGWAEPGHSRASVSTPGTVLASPRLALKSQLLPLSLPRFVRFGSKCWVRPPARSVFVPPGTRLTAAPWRAPCSPRAWSAPGARPPSRRAPELH